MMARLDARTAYSHATVLTAGIVANNASGMCCGVANNTYNTLDHMRLVFADGTLLDTADKDSCARFLKASKPEAISSRDQATKQL
jgi:D-lactate dehydrogenase